jgi:hypothetical protein
MTGLVRKAILITVGASMYAGAAMAVTPSAANSSFQTTPIALVGRNAANTPAEDSFGQFAVTVRDAGNVPIQGATVTVNFNACTPDIILSRVQSFTGVSVLCNGARGVVSGQTNSLGVVTFRILGGADNNSGNEPGATTACAELRANNVFFTNLAVAALDQTNNLDGVLPGDLSVLITDINQGNLARRSDVNLDGVVNPGDVGVMINHVNAGRSSQNTVALCP